MVAQAEYLHVHVCVILYTALGRGKHALEHSQNTTMCQSKLSPIFQIVILRRQRLKTKETEGLDVETL